MSAPRRPDYSLKVRPRGDGSKKQSRVGAAWLNADRSVSIVLNVGVELRWDDELFIGLYLDDDGPEAAP